MEKSAEVFHSSRKRRVALVSSVALLTAAGTGTVTLEDYRTSCSDDIAPVGTYVYESTLPDITQSQVLDSKARTAYLETVDEVYGIEISFADTITVKNAETVTETINGAVTAFEDYSARLTNNLEINDFIIAEEVTSGEKNAGGLYLIDEKSIQIKQGSIDATKEHVAHELWHAIDYQFLCPKEDVQVDTAVAQYTTVDIALDEDGELLEPLDPIYYHAHPERQFANTYATQNIREDRATQAEQLFYYRGIILEDDPDFHSPYQQKQAETIRRMEMLLPGITNHLESITPSLRASATDLTESIEHPYKPHQLSRVGAILSHAFLHDIPIEQLRNTTLTVSIPGEQPRTVQDPAVIRDRHRAIKGFAWTDFSSESQTTTMYYDPTLIEIHYTQDSYTYQGLLHSINLNDTGNKRTGVKVGDTWAQEIAPTSN